jgi:S-adenosylmethionine hydrolase
VAGQPVASTFDGRDVFAPLAARLAVDADAALRTLDPIGVDELVSVELPRAQVAGGWVDAEVVRVDGFGNLLLSTGASAVADAGWPRGQRVRLHLGDDVHHATVARAFGELGEGRLGVLADSFGRLQIVVDRGCAAEVLGAELGTQVTIVTHRSDGAGRAEPAGRARQA